MDKTKKGQLNKELELFARAILCVQTEYVDDIEPRSLVYGALRGLLNDLDPHSQFLTPDEHEDLKIETEGRFGGIGVEISVRDRLVTIVTPIEGTPAWSAGIKTNDRIVKINDTLIKNFTLNDTVKILRGAPGTEVVVVVWRENDGKLYTFKIKRALIEIKDIKEAKMLESHIGYIKLAEFRQNTPEELDRILKDFKYQKMEALIFDLRNNPGGLLEEAVQVASRFLPKGTLIVSIKGRDPKKDEVFNADFADAQTKMPVVVLVNGGSASGSEIVAGALQDHKRAVILGEKTFGKGSVQTVFPLDDGSALKITTSRYFTPAGHSIHEKGITPDILAKEDSYCKKPEVNKEEDIDAIFENFEENKIEVVKPESQEKDTQLQRAIDLIKSIMIYRNVEGK
ncbi:MAG TPA: S41 family peptidase [Candidatus Omnitrophota bacterium]|nr:S41 family peptidase [Candidatus Omnitrophota bacterium]